MGISIGDRERLRALAGQQAQLAVSPAMRTLYKEWVTHGQSGTLGRPMVRIELWTFEQDILPPLYQCTGEEARAIERRLLSNIVNHTLFGDDTLVPDHYGVYGHGWFKPFGLTVKRRETGGVGHHFVSYLYDLEKDMHVLNESEYGWRDNPDEADLAHDLFGDLLPVRPSGMTLGSSPMQDLVHIMDMEDLYMAMFDTPDLFVQVLERLTDDYAEYFRFLQNKGVLVSAARGQHLAQGSYCFTDRLPDLKESARLTDLWLYMDSQETSGVSPEMYAQLVFPSYEKLMALFGRVSYGCCEAVHALWEPCLKRITNLGKVSISPWCDEPMMGDALRGSDIVFLRKPTPNLLGVGAPLPEEEVTKHLSATGMAARGCKLEVSQRDVYRINGTPDKVRRYVTLIRQALADTWH
ncbi:MAG: hypothetical protein GX810_03335 [Clostridiales bacterium]|nr:hypothetical protein [Clostridiales bacterium]